MPKYPEPQVKFSPNIVRLSISGRNLPDLSFYNETRAEQESRDSTPRGRDGPVQKINFQTNSLLNLSSNDFSPQREYSLRRLSLRTSLYKR